MKTASAREVQHHFNRVLKWVESGDEVEITKRNKPVAKLTAISQDPPKPPDIDFFNRAVELWQSQNEKLSDIIIDQRTERI